jgi:hypothetical protein
MSPIPCELQNLNPLGQIVISSSNFTQIGPAAAKHRPNPILLFLYIIFLFALLFWPYLPLKALEDLDEEFDFDFDSKCRQMAIFDEKGWVNEPISGRGCRCWCCRDSSF